MSFRQVSIAIVTAAWTAVACAYDYVERDAVVMYYQHDVRFGRTGGLRVERQRRDVRCRHYVQCLP